MSGSPQSVIQMACVMMGFKVDNRTRGNVQYIQCSEFVTEEQDAGK